MITGAKVWNCGKVQLPESMLRASLLATQLSYPGLEKDPELRSRLYAGKLVSYAAVRWSVMFGDVISVVSF
jgi:hypothetical protein